MKIKVNAQSSVRIEADRVICFDPYMIKHKTNDADIIFITHPHHDHFSPDDIAKLSNENTIIVAPASMILSKKQGQLRCLPAPNCPLQSICTV